MGPILPKIIMKIKTQLQKKQNSANSNIYNQILKLYKFKSGNLIFIVLKLVNKKYLKKILIIYKCFLYFKKIR